MSFQILMQVCHRCKEYLISSRTSDSGIKLVVQQLVQCRSHSQTALRSSYRGLHDSQKQVAMKFGKLLRHTVDSRMPQWRNYTLGYKPLKQHIKQLQAQLAAQGARSSARLSSRLPECTSPLPHHACTALSQPAAARGQRQQFSSRLAASSLWLTRPCCAQASRPMRPAPVSPRRSTSRSKR